MSAQQVCLQSTNLEVSIQQLEFSSSIADDRSKIGPVNGYLAAVQMPFQGQGAYRWHVVLLLIAHGTRQLDFTSRDGSIPDS